MDTNSLITSNTTLECHELTAHASSSRSVLATVGTPSSPRSIRSGASSLSQCGAGAGSSTSQHVCSVAASVGSAPTFSWTLDPNVYTMSQRFRASTDIGSMKLLDNPSLGTPDRFTDTLCFSETATSPQAVDNLDKSTMSHSNITEDSQEKLENQPPQLLRALCCDHDNINNSIIQNSAIGKTKASEALSSINYENLSRDGFASDNYLEKLEELGEFKVAVNSDDFNFSCGHFVAYDGYRERLHGHNYTVRAMLGGRLNPDGYVTDFTHLKRVIRETCKSLSQYVIIPMNSDVLLIKKNGRSIYITTQDGAEFMLPLSDCLCLPIMHSTAEELAAYIWNKILEKLGVSFLQQRAIRLVQSISVQATGMAVATSGPDLQEADIWGTYTFEFGFKLHNLGPSQGHLVASAWRKNGNTVPIRCRWKRKIAGLYLDIPGVFGTEYPISADDIASKVIVEATALDCGSTSNEVAYAELGPFELDTAARRNLDNYLALGGARFPVMLKAGHNNNGSNEQQDLVFHVSEEEIKIIKPGPSNVGYVEDWHCKYGAEYPRIQILPHDLSSFELFLSPNEKLSLAAMTRSQRDLLTLTVRCFHGRQWLANSLLLQNVALSATKQLNDLRGESSKNSDIPELTTDFLVVLQRLTGELHRSLYVTEKSIKERDRAQLEKNALEDDIAATIGAYQQLLAQGSTDRTSTIDGQTAQTVSLEITQRAAHVAEVEGKLKESQQQAEKYLSELERLRRDFRGLQAKLGNNNHTVTHPDSLTFSRADPLRLNSQRIRLDESTIPDSFKTEELRQKIEMLQKAHTELLREKENKDRDLERMRQSQKLLQQSSMMSSSNLESVTSTKMTLEKRIAELSARNEELTENFLYMKTKYDQLIEENKSKSSKLNDTTIGTSQLLTIAQAREAEAERKLTEVEKNLSRVKAELDTAITERNRFQKQTQALTRDLEKTRNQFQALMELNQELTGDKATAQEQLKEIQALFSQQQTNQVESFENLESTVGTLKKQNEAKDAIIEQLQKENEMFRSRLRKMAAA